MSKALHTLQKELKDHAKVVQSLVKEVEKRLEYNKPSWNVVGKGRQTAIRLERIADELPQAKADPAAAAVQTNLFDTSQLEAVDTQPALPPDDGLWHQDYHIVVLDVETKRSAQEVGGWGRADKMGISVGVAWDSKKGQYYTFNECNLRRFLGYLNAVDLVVGFNIERFDYKVMAGYAPDFDFSCIQTFDLLAYCAKTLGHRLPLGNLAQATLNAPKSADGLQALQWYKEGRLDLIEAYCQKDVEITRDLFCYGLCHKRLYYTPRTRSNSHTASLPTDWDLAQLSGRAVCPLN